MYHLGGLLGFVGDAVHGVTHDVGGGLAFVGFGGRLLDDIGDLPGILAGAFGQLADLLGDDHEALAVFAGAGRLDCGIERQDVGAVGDLGDHLGDLVDLAAALRDRIGYAGQAFVRGKPRLRL